MKISPSWLVERVDRPVGNARASSQEIYSEMYGSLSTSIIHMTNGFTERFSFERVWEIVTTHVNLSYDASSASSSLSVVQMREEIMESELHATEH